MASLVQTATTGEPMSTSRNAPAAGGMHQSPQIMSRPRSHHQQQPTDRFFSAGSGNHAQSNARADLNMSYNSPSQLSEPSGLPADRSDIQIDEWEHQYQPSKRVAEAAM